MATSGGTYSFLSKLLVENTPENEETKESVATAVAADANQTQEGSNAVLLRDKVSNRRKETKKEDCQTELKTKVWEALEQDYADYGPYVEEHHQSFRQNIFAVMKTTTAATSKTAAATPQGRKNPAAKRQPPSLPVPRMPPGLLDRRPTLLSKVSKFIVLNIFLKGNVPSRSSGDGVELTSDASDIDHLTERSPYGEISTIWKSLFGYSKIPNVGTRLLHNAFQDSRTPRYEKSEEEKAELRYIGIGVLVGGVLAVLIIGLSVTVTGRPISPLVMDTGCQNGSQTPVWIQCECNSSANIVSEAQINEVLALTERLGLSDSSEELVVCEPNVLARFWMSSRNIQQEELVQTYALSTLYFALDTGALNWMTKNVSSVCSWDEVRCDSETNQVVELWLSKKALEGPLPLEIGRMTALRVLELGENSISQQTNFSALSNLWRLALDSNELSGPFNGEIYPPSLIELLLSENLLSGTLDGVGALVSLQKLSLQNNSLDGPFPTELFELTNLQDLDLSHNLMNGSLPSNLPLQELEYLNISGSAFEGEIPLNWTNSLHSLEELDLNSLEVSSETLEEFCTKLENLVEIIIACSGTTIVCSCCTCSDEHYSLDKPF